MLKHRLSPVPLPPPKRHHTVNGGKAASIPLLNFDISLYDELALHIFSLLSWVDLCTIQSTNRHWARLTTDNQLWKNLFIREFGRQRLRGSRGFVTKKDNREIRPLPHRAKGDDIIDWKWMFRISSNWRKGRCILQRLDENPSHDEAYDQNFYSCIVLAGSLTVTTSITQSPTPAIYLHQKDAIIPFALHGRHRSTTPTHITALSLDQSPPKEGDHTLRLAAFYATGEFTIFRIDHSTPRRSLRIASYFPGIKTERTSPIREACYHHPLLITLAHSFKLSLYRITSDTIEHTQTLTSFTSFPPTSMVLTPGLMDYRLILAYSSPIYPAHWSVAVTVLTISGAQSTVSDSSADSVQPCTVSATRTVRCYDIPLGWTDEAAIRSIREQWGRKVAGVADTQTDGKWVVLAPIDQPTSPSTMHSSYHARLGTTSCALQLYRLHIPSMNASSNATPRMTFVRMLYGHTGPVIALALADGRCVSLGADGSLWVWDLEKGWGVEVQATHRSFDPDGSTNSSAVASGVPLGKVVFDERRIVSADIYGIEARRFDI